MFFRHKFDVRLSHAGSMRSRTQRLAPETRTTARVVKAFMRAIDSRGQDSLSRICRKLREGDIMKFVSELTHDYVKDQEVESSELRVGSLKV
jgi:hypothetical protein